MNSLKQTGMAIESYCGDYGQYYPSWPASGGDIQECLPGASSQNIGQPSDLGLYSDSTHAVRSGGLRRPTDTDLLYNWRSEFTKFRTLFNGCTNLNLDASGSAGALRDAGQLNAAPIGLGFLATTNFISDVRMFFCPSAGDNMPPNWGYTQTGTVSPSNTNTVHRVSQMKRAGGFTGKNMTHGAWKPGQALQRAQSVARISGTWTSLDYLVVQGNYDYRNVPACVALYDSASFTSMLVGGARIAGVRPGRDLYPGEPFFKTQKQQGGRAVVSDSFSSPRANAAPMAEPGVGRYAHMEGYNVLYGDASASWYGDPQQTIIWYDVKNGATYIMGGSSGSPSVALERNCIGSWSATDDSLSRSYRSAVDIWRLFDNAHDMDIP